MKLSTVFAALMALLVAAPAAANEIFLKTAGHEAYPKFKIGAPADGSPIEGLAVDIMNAISKRDPMIRFAVAQRFVPWKRLQSDLAKGDVDIFFGLVRNAEREKKYHFIETPLYFLRHKVAVRKDDPINISTFDDIAALDDQGIIVSLQGSGTVSYMLGQNRSLRISDTASGVLGGLRMIVQNRGRFFYYHDLAIYGGIKRLGYEDRLRVLPAVFRDYAQWAAFAPTVAPEVRDRVATVIAELETDGSLARLFRSYVPSESASLIP